LDAEDGPGHVTGGGGEDFVAGIGEHVVLLGVVDHEIIEPGEHRMVAIGNFHQVIHAPVRRMGDELATRQQVVIPFGAEGVAHPAMPAGEADPGRDGCAEPLHRLGFVRRTERGPVVDDQVLLRHQRLIQVGVEGVRAGHREAVVFEESGKEITGLFRLMAIPPATDDQGIAHR